MSLLDVKNLVTEFKTEDGTVQAVRNISFHIDGGEVLGIVGESGSGKSQTMFSVMGLLADNGAVMNGEIVFDGKDISSTNKTKAEKKAYEKIMQTIRGKDMAMIFQDPMTFLNPVLRIETQLIEPLLNHTKMSKAEAKQKAIEMMERVGIPNPQERIRQYPHQFSGGMRQRIVIAIALMCHPKLIIADEPTTALDVTIQAQVLELIQSLQKEQNTSIIMITHDLGVVANMCDRIVIMYGGKIVEQGTDNEIFYEAKHPYTLGLLESVNNPENKEKTELKPIPGSPPDLLHPPVGCPFVDRCEKAMKVCKDQEPPITEITKTQFCSCWLLQKEGMMNHE